MSNEKFREYIEYVLRGLVDKPDSLTVELIETEKNYVITVKLPADNVGQIIGKKGKLRKALETVFWGASGAQTDQVKGNMIEFVEID